MPPVGLVLQIDGAASVTSDYYVDLSIAVTGATEMRFSNDGFTYKAWQPYAATELAWDIRGYGGNANSGVHSVWVEVRDALDDRVKTFASIEYRQAKPSIKLYPNPVQRAGSMIVDIPLMVYENYGNPAHVILAEWTLDGTFTDGGNITFMPNDANHDGVSGLSTSRNGIIHNLVWNAGIDIDPADVSDIAQVRFQVSYANESSEVATSQQFFVDTRDPIEVADLQFTRGDSADIKIVLLDRNGVPYDATGDVQITSIKDPSGNERLVAPITATRTSLGYYVGSYAVPSDADIGLWLATWSYTADYVDAVIDSYFSIIEETYSYSPIGTDTCVVYGQLIGANQKPLVSASVHILPHHLSDPEYGNVTSISTNHIVVETDLNGRFDVELVKNTELIIYIPSLTFRQLSKVPDSDTAEFRSIATTLPVPPRDQFGNRV